MTVLPVDFSAFHQMNRAAYIRYAETILNNRADAEEAVDVCFEKLLRYWDAVLSKENPAGYAWTVLRHCTMDACTARARRPVPFDTAAFHTEALLTAVDPIGQLEESLNLFHTVRQLPPRQMDVVLLLHAHGMTTHKVAEHLGITTASVRSNARHAIRRLRELLHLDTDTEGTAG
jgi:RNA polymerase sigma-70 factor (ECF subfamily)